ncbi:MAG: small multi-drug export protein [Christensenellaceae bacterium]
MEVIPTIDYLAVFGTSMLPIWELKGAIPLGLGLGIPFWTTYLLALFGSCLPVPFIIIFIKKIIEWMQKSKVNFLNKFSNWLMGKVHKHQDKIKKYGYWALFTFVAIPLPMTGVWTGSLLAGVLDLRAKYAIPVVIGGNICAGLLMLALSSIFFPGMVPWAA